MSELDKETEPSWPSRSGGYTSGRAPAHKQAFVGEKFLNSGGIYLNNVIKIIFV
jgi:hypothetical protein